MDQLFEERTMSDSDLLSVQVSFPGSVYSSISISSSTPLAEVLTVQNSPVLFGCRTGICGTCMVKVWGEVLPPEPSEQEVLAAYGATAQMRLACQLVRQGDIEIRAIAEVG
jgi:ferredoxin